MKPRGGDTLSVFQTDLKPVISEIARTQVCFPSIKLLVDKIELDNISSNDTFSGAFRLWLTDGEKCIQALVRRRLYKMIIGGDVREGTYILLKEYLLARGNRIYGEGEVLYLVLKDFYAIGEDDREKPEIPDFLSIVSKAIGAEQSNVPSPTDDASLEHIFPMRNPSSSSRPRRRLVDERPTSRSSAIGPKDDLDKTNEIETPSQIAEEPPCGPPCSSSNKSGARKRKMEIALGEIDPNFASSPPKKAARVYESLKKDSLLEGAKKASSPQGRMSSSPRARQQEITKIPVLSDKTRSGETATVACSTSKPAMIAHHTNPAQAIHAITSAPRISHHRLAPIERALNIIPLSKLRGYPRRNDVYDVFVVVYSVGNEVIKRPRMPPKRDLRIVDPSTEKKVLLSIFVDPDKFMPVVGTAALIRSVTTHEWDGGMINVYPKQCEGKEWFMPDPVGVQGCDVGRLREWWVKRQAEEAQHIEKEKT